MLNFTVVHVWMDLHALIMNNFEHMVLRIEPINTAVQRCTSRSTEFASRQKIVGENRGKM